MTKMQFNGMAQQNSSSHRIGGHNRFQMDVNIEGLDDIEEQINKHYLQTSRGNKKPL